MSTISSNPSPSSNGMAISAISPNYTFLKILEHCCGGHVWEGGYRNTFTQRLTSTISLRFKEGAATCVRAGLN